MEESRFRKALYYAVREDFNADISLGHVEKNKNLDALIQEAIAFIEGLPEGGQIPYTISQIELIGLANASQRRKQPHLFSQRRRDLNERRK